MVKLSVIIPYYNAENYLERSIESVLSQKVDFQIVLVDDGSSDLSGVIADSYAQKNSIIQSLHIEHRGVSAARNCGIENSDGEYITFLDADDWLDDNCLHNDIFVGNFDVIRIPCNVSSSMIHYYEDVLCNDIQTTHNFIELNYCCACWARLYKRSIIANVRFNENLRMGEDILFFVELFPFIANFHVVSGEIGYHYSIDNLDSASHKLGYSADLKNLVSQLQIHASSGNKLAWKYLFNPCYNHCLEYGLKSFFYQSFGWMELILAPVPFRKRCHLLKRKLMM